MHHVGSAHALEVWEWRPGMAWRRVLELAGPTADGIAHDALTHRPYQATRATIAAELELDPNHASADELLELADAIAGPVPDLVPRPRHG